MRDTNDIQKEIAEIESRMMGVDFWKDKHKAQVDVKTLQDLKDELEGVGKYDKGDAIVTIFSGAGGDDAEDFSRILFEMYTKFVSKNNWDSFVLHENKNEQGGYRNITFEVQGKKAYGTLKNESGVHRLVRLSPFNSKQQRHTSFSMVEVIPKFEVTSDIEISEQDLRFEFSRSSGPGGQNVNKRETAVRIVHEPTGLAGHSDAERSQEQNREKAMQILRGKIFKALEEERVKKDGEMYISKTTEIEWGNQIRSYVFHPYKMIKDHRTNTEVRDIESVLDGNLDTFIEAEKDL